MPLSSLIINNFRNFNTAELDLNDTCNIFYGENGSGKTSILEAIYYLVLGRSFRSHLLRRIVKYDSNDFSIFGKIKQDHNLTPIGITRSIETGKRIRIAGKDVDSNIELTKLLPLQLLNHNSYFFLYEGPKARRQFMDWGLFHVEQSFLTLWRKVERILEQRNIALRTKASTDQIRAWDKDLVQFGHELHACRKQYVEELIPIVHAVLKNLSLEFSVDISYFPGWNQKIDLDSMLISNLKNDLQFGYTTAGPQRADIQLLVKGIPAKDALSRGQQKILLYGLQIAQGILLNKLTKKSCIYLVDDLAAELDLQKYTVLSNVLLSLPGAQLFVTGLEQQKLEAVFSANADKKIFQIDNGVINK